MAGTAIVVMVAYVSNRKVPMHAAMSGSHRRADMVNLRIGR
ncbi:Uncharacterised protein [Mycobacteroides abscessus subsp. abscessus]|nr:Uncharacterised protein [Mycobacteroides abscessus subsp. abscessus]